MALLADAKVAHIRSVPLFEHCSGRDLREIARIAHRVIELSSGKVVSDGPPEGGEAEISELHW